MVELEEITSNPLLMVQHFTAKVECKEFKKFTLWCYELCLFIYFCKKSNY